MSNQSGEPPVTDLLQRLRGGDQAAMGQLFNLVYDDLRRRAHRLLDRGPGGQTIDTTALVHEAYLKLVHPGAAAFNDRGHFFAVASRAMRQILVDNARRKLALKRGGGLRPVTLDAGGHAGAAPAEELVALDEALEALEAADERLARTVEIRFFGGLSVEETAEALGVSPRTVKRDWQKARAFLYQAMMARDGP